MKRIKMGGKKENVFCILDDEDYEKYKKFNWWLSCGYPARYRKNGTIYMHREIMNTPKGMETDHINGDRLDNRKENLRICTTSENQCNRKKINGENRHRGITLRRNKWVVRICRNHKSFWLGSFEREIDAIKCWNAKAKELSGDFVILNSEE